MYGQTIWQWASNDLDHDDAFENSDDAAGARLEKLAVNEWLTVRYGNCRVGLY